MDEKILELLNQIANDISDLKVSQQKLQEGQERIEKNLKTVFDQTADLTEFRTDITSKLNVITENIAKINISLCRVEEATAYNWADIAKLKSAR